MARPKARRPRDIMIIDYDKCLRVPTEDAVFARPTIPMRCPECVTHRGSLTPLTASGRLMFEGERPPFCDNHEPAVEMVPVNA